MEKDLVRGDEGQASGIFGRKAMFTTRMNEGLKQAARLHGQIAARERGRLKIEIETC
jgi:hypothetical protein